MKSKFIDTKQVRNLFTYNELSGEIKYKERNREEFSDLRSFRSWNSQHAGRVTGSEGECGAKGSKRLYLKTRMGGRFYYVHRLIWVYMTGQQPDTIDHIDGNGLNNKWSNLRSVPHSINGKNQKIHTTNTSGSSGVTYRKDSDKWRARIMVNEVMISLGTFKNKDDAITARKQGERDYW